MLSSKPGDKTMNTKIAFAAVALSITLVCGFQFAPAIADSLTTAATIDSNHAAPMTASQKTRCTMPATHWKGCGA